MRKKALLPLLIIALALAGSGFAQETGTTLSMSLEECIVKALKDNLGVAIQVLGPQISAEAVNAAQEQVHPDHEPELQLEKDGERGLFLPRCPRRQLDQ